MPDMYALSLLSNRVHIRLMCEGLLRVPPLRRLTFGKQPQK